MELLINIPKWQYEAVRNGKFDIGVQTNILCSVIQGIPLPKGHGRLIDGDRLRSMYSINRANFNTVVGIQKWIDNAPTVIGADEEE